MKSHKRRFDDDADTGPARVEVTSEGVIRMIESRSQSVDGVRQAFDRLRSLADGWERIALIVDLQHAERPSVHVRRQLRAEMASIDERLVFVGVAVGRNILMRAAVRFVVSGTHLTARPFRTVEEAERAARLAA